MLCLIVFLSSCSNACVPEVKQIKVSPPEVYLQKVYVEPCAKKTNEDLLKCYLKTKTALERANQDKARIADFYKV